jgi:hypothetical protein
MKNAKLPLRDSVFTCYSHSDRTMLEEVQLHLSAVLRRSVINVFDDTKILPGEKWLDRIREELATAKVALLLVSTPFLASRFVREVEVPELLRAAEKDGVRILCLFVSHCAYDTVPEISQFQAVNDPHKPLSDLRKSQRDKVLVGLAKIIAEAMASPS